MTLVHDRYAPMVWPFTGFKKRRNRGKDRYERTLGRGTCPGVDANAVQVRRGMAWVYERYAAKGSPLYGLQAEAQGARQGLWG